MRWKPPRRRCWWRRALRWLDDIEALEALYGAASANSLRKVARRMTPAYRQWIAASRFVVVASVGPEGTDASPRGDDGPVVLELDPGKRIKALKEEKGEIKTQLPFEFIIK